MIIPESTYLGVGEVDEDELHGVRVRVLVGGAVGRHVLQQLTHVAAEHAHEGGGRNGHLVKVRGGRVGQVTPGVANQVLVQLQHIWDERRMSFL